jgi:hypothetical protein
VLHTTSFTYELKHFALFLVRYYTSVGLLCTFYVIMVCFDLVIILWVLTLCRFVFRQRRFRETCFIHCQLLVADFERPPAALKMVAVYSTEPYRRVKLRYVASCKTTSWPYSFNLYTVSNSTEHNVDCMLLHAKSYTAYCRRPLEVLLHLQQWDLL